MRDLGWAGVESGNIQFGRTITFRLTLLRNGSASRWPNVTAILKYLVGWLSPHLHIRSAISVLLYSWCRSGFKVQILMEGPWSIPIRLLSIVLPPQATPLSHVLKFQRRSQNVPSLPLHLLLAPSQPGLRLRECSSYVCQSLHGSFPRSSLDSAQLP